MDRREEMVALRSTQARLKRIAGQIESLFAEIAEREQEEGVGSAQWQGLKTALNAFQSDTEQRIEQCKRAIRGVRSGDAESKATSSTQAVVGDKRRYPSKSVKPALEKGGLSVREQYVERLAFLEEQREKYEAMVNRVRELLSKADTRRLAEPNNARHWNSVVDNLEESLIESKSRRELCEVELARTQKELEILERSPEVQAADLEIPEALRGVPSAVQEGDVSTTKKLLNMSLDEIGNLSLEEVAKLHEQVATENVEAAVLDVDQLVQYMGDEKPAYAQETPVAQQITQAPVSADHLTEALVKIRGHRAEALTDAETVAFLEAYPAIMKSLPDTAKGQRLGRILKAAVISLKKRMG